MRRHRKPLPVYTGTRLVWGCAIAWAITALFANSAWSMQGTIKTIFIPGAEESAEERGSASAEVETPSADSDNSDSDNSDQPKRSPSVWIAPVEVRPISEPAQPATPATKPERESSRRVRLEIQPLSVNGIRVGDATFDALVGVFGEPVKQSDLGDALALEFESEEYQQIDATLVEGKLESLVFTLDEAKTTDALAAKLDIASSTPAFVRDEHGKSLGVTYPEHGIVFLFTSAEENRDQPADELGERSNQIFYGPISGEAFLLRAKERPPRDTESILHDLEFAQQYGGDDWQVTGLRAKTLITERKLAEAIKALEEVTQPTPADSGLLLVVAQTQHASGDSDAALATIKTLNSLSPTPLQAAHAQLVLGDVYASGPVTDYALAAQHHYAAIEALESIEAAKTDPWLIMTRTELLAQATVAFANDIANREYANKREVVPQWHLRADELLHEIFNESQVDPLFQLEIEAKKVASAVPIPKSVSLTQHLTKIQTIHEAISNSSNTVIRQQADQVCAEAYYHASLVLYARGAHEDSMRYSEYALQLFDQLTKNSDMKERARYRVACCQFVQGVIHAIRDNDHATAVQWYEKAVASFESPPPKTLEHEIGLHGERLVSMGVSYWSADRKDRALSTTRSGKAFVQLAIDRGLLDEAAIETPTNNLNQMLQQIQRDDPDSEQIEAISSRRTTETRR